MAKFGTVRKVLLVAFHAWLHQSAIRHNGDVGKQLLRQMRGALKVFTGKFVCVHWPPPPRQPFWLAEGQKNSRFVRFDDHGGGGRAMCLFGRKQTAASHPDYGLPKTSSHQITLMQTNQRTSCYLIWARWNRLELCAKEDPGGSPWHRLRSCDLPDQTQICGSKDSKSLRTCGFRAKPIELRRGSTFLWGEIVVNLCAERIRRVFRVNEWPLCSLFICTEIVCKHKWNVCDQPSLCDNIRRSFSKNDHRKLSCIKRHALTATLSSYNIQM